MSSRVVKWLFLASVLLLALPVVAMASSSRVDGLGVQGDYIKDYTNVYSYLSNICCVGNIVYGEMGNWWSDSQTMDRAVGAFIQTKNYGTFGIHLREEMGQLGAPDANTAIDANGTWDTNENGNHAFDIMWGKKFGQMSLGLRLNRAYAHVKGDPYLFTYYDSDFYQGWLGWGISEMSGDYYHSEDPYTMNFNRNVLGFGVGVGYEYSPTLNLEAGFNYQVRDFSAQDSLYGKVDTAGVKYENDGSGAYLFTLRALWQAQPNLMVVPVFRYFNMKANMKLTVKDAYGPYPAPLAPEVKFPFDPITNERSGWQIGLAGNWALNQNDLFVLGASFGQTTYKYKEAYYQYYYDEGVGAYRDTIWTTYDYQYKDTYLPILFAGLETHLNPWLTFRFGAQQGAFYTSEYDAKDVNYTAYSDKRNYKNHYSWFEMYTGVGVKLGTLQMDATLNQSFLHNGPYLVSGESTSYLFPKVTATYTF